MKLKFGLFFALAPFFLGCAQAAIQKVPNRSDYAKWSDDDQRRVDSLCGHRYYLQRPYVVVHRPFPVKSKTYLVDAQVSDDGRRIRVIGGQVAKLHEDLPHLCFLGDRVLDAQCVWQQAEQPRAQGGPNLLVTPAPGQGTIPAAPPPPSAPAPGPESGAPTPAEPPAGQPPGVFDAGSTKPPEPETSALPAAQPTTTPDTGDDTVVEPPGVDTPADTTSADVRTGTADFRISTDRKGMPVQNINDYFSIVYLPDFEEQYVIDPKANLGALDLTLTQGPGGILMAMGMQVDNSAITRPLVDAYTDLIKSGTAAAKGAMGLPAAESEQLVVPPGAEHRARTAPGSIVTLRVHVVSMATPGFYPILKASETLDTRCCLRNLSRCSTCQGQREPCGPCASQGSILDCLEQVDLAAPVMPFTRVAYAVHKTIIVEHLIPDTPSILNAGLASFSQPRAQSKDLEVAQDPHGGLRAELNNLLVACKCSLYTITAIDAVEPAGATKLNEVMVLTLRFQRLVGGQATSIHAALRASDEAAVRCCLLSSGRLSAGVRLTASAE